MTQGRYISYLRVSTKRQGQSGLGLEAQRSSVENHLNGSDWNLLGEFVEVESGKRTDRERPQLKEALQACRVHQATLIVAKIDRLARNAHFLLGLRDAGVEFVAADMPDANRMTVGILAIVAEMEAIAISERTKSALAAAKRRGVVLGNPKNATPEGRRKGCAKGSLINQEKAHGWATLTIRPVIERIQDSGVTSYRGIATKLNQLGVPTRRGKLWFPTSVKNVIKNYDAKEA
jgi:DNA invertase Pin-like site-specific DNA recombinase